MVLWSGSVSNFPENLWDNTHWVALRKAPGTMFLWSKKDAIRMSNPHEPQVCECLANLIVAICADFTAFLAEEITSLIRGPDFDPYESGERWDPLLATKGGRCDPGW